MDLALNLHQFPSGFSTQNVVMVDHASWIKISEEKKMVCIHTRRKDKIGKINFVMGIQRKMEICGRKCEKGKCNVRINIGLKVNLVHL